MSYQPAPALPDGPRALRADRPHVILGIDLTAAGARPGAHRARGGFAALPFDGERFVRLVRTADRGRLDLVVLDETFLLHPGRGRVIGRLDAAVAAARVAPLAPGAGFVVGVDALHLDPAQVASAIAGVERASGGLAAWQVGLAPDADERIVGFAAVAARRTAAHWQHGGGGELAGLDPEGRRSVDHDGVRFAVRRPTPARALPQGRPPISVRVRDAADVRLAATTADVVRLVAPDRAGVVALRAALRDAIVAAGRDPGQVRVLAEVFVVLAEQDASAQARLAMVRDLEGPDAGGGAVVVAGTPHDLARLVSEWAGAGVVDGFVLRPAALDADLTAIVTGLVPELEERGLRPAEARAGTLRERLALAAAAPQPAAVGPAAGQPAAAGRAARQSAVATREGAGVGHPSGARRPARAGALQPA